jgi:hypothetical protein
VVLPEAPQGMNPPDVDEIFISTQP